MAYTSYVNILEGLRFYVSFACSFAFSVNLNLWKVVQRLYRLLLETDTQHLAVSQRIINNYRGAENDKVMNKVIKSNEKYVEQLYKDAVDEEKRWATHLFSKGSMVGLSEKLLHNYVEWTANKRMKAIGMKLNL